MTITKITPLEIYKLLPQSNCRKCILPSCLAFAAAVASGQKKITDCPDIAPMHASQINSRQDSTPHKEQQAKFIDKLCNKICHIDLRSRAAQIGAKMKNDKLHINSMGKDFIVDTNGNLTSECHIIPWVQAPLLSYITNKTHSTITGEWISFREIKGGIDWQGLFTSRCETPLRQLADHNPHLLSDIIELFMGKPLEWYQADIAFTLHPLPHCPILICYQAPEDDLESVLTIFFDRCCPDNLHVKSIFTLCSGLVQMFSKIAQHH